MLPRVIAALHVRRPGRAALCGGRPALIRSDGMVLLRAAFGGGWYGLRMVAAIWGPSCAAGRLLCCLQAAVLLACCCAACRLRAPLAGCCAAGPAMRWRHAALQLAAGSRAVTCTQQKGPKGPPQKAPGRSICDARGYQ